MQLVIASRERGESLECKNESRRRNKRRSDRVKRCFLRANVVTQPFTKYFLPRERAGMLWGSLEISITQFYVRDRFSSLRNGVYFSKLKKKMLGNGDARHALASLN